MMWAQCEVRLHGLPAEPVLQEPTVPGKECRRCNVFKAATEFYRNKTNPDGLYNNCKACFAADAWSRCVFLTSTAKMAVMSGIISRSLGLQPIRFRNSCWVY